jgi:hypothetical protein
VSSEVRELEPQRFALKFTRSREVISRPLSVSMWATEQVEDRWHQRSGIRDPVSVNPTHCRFAKSEFLIGEKDRGLMGHRSPVEGVSQKGLRSEAKCHRGSGSESLR